MGILLKCRLTAILFLTHVLCNGQTIEEQFSFRHLTEQNGLSYNIVNAMIKDHRGFLWIATYDGLNRFDGFHFTVYKNNRHDPFTLTNNTVHQICEDKAGNIWAGTEDGISCWHPNTGRFENYALKEFTGANYTGNIICAKNGKIWATAKDALLEYIPATNRFIIYPFNSPDIYAISSMAIYKNGLIEDPLQKGLWLATSKGLNFFDYASNRYINYRNDKTHPEIFNDHIVSALFKGSNNKILYADNTVQQLRKFETLNYTTESIPLDNNINKNGEIATILEDSRGNYWLSSWSYNAFFIEGKNHNRQILFRHDDAKPNSVTGDFFWSAYEDAEGTVWLGTVGGISFTNPYAKNFQLHELDSRIPLLKIHGGVTSIRKDSDSSYWIATLKDGLLHYFPAIDSIVQYDAPAAKLDAESNGRVSLRALLVLKDKIAVGTDEGPYFFDKRLKRFMKMPGVTSADGMMNHRAAYIVKQNDSIIWVRSFDNGLHRYNLTSEKWKHYGIGNDSVLAGDKPFVRNIFVDNRKRFWIVVVPRTLAMFHENSNDFVVENNEQKDTVMGSGYFADVTVDNQNRFWIATKGSGLVMYDPANKTTKRWSESEGLVFNHIMAVQADNNGKIWAAGYNKISMFDPVANTFENFSFPISPSNYSYVNRFIKLDDGRLVVSINSTLLLIDPAQMNGIKSNRKTLIDGIRVFDQLKTFDAEKHSISLRHFENFINISYGIITNSDPNRYRFVYMLEGYDKNWIEAGTATSAAYTSLPGGNYTFRVKAVSNQEKWQAEEAVLYIKVVPPFYKTTWFYALLTFVFAAVIFAMIRYRIYTIRKTAQQKNELNKMMNEWQLKALRSQMNPHFIFNCLNSIDNYILKNDEVNASRYLNKFSRLVRIILNHSDANTTTLANEVEMLKYYMELETLRFDEPFSFTIDIDDDIDLEETEIPSMLLQPYVENAILHGLKHKNEKGHLHIKITTKNNMLVCSIEDDGIGRKKAAEIKARRPELHTSKGLGITEQRLKMLHEAGGGTAAVTITDPINKNGEASGTSVEIRIPYEKD